MGKSRNKKQKRQIKEQSGRHVKKGLMQKQNERETKNHKWKDEV